MTREAKQECAGQEDSTLPLKRDPKAPADDTSPCPSEEAPQKSVIKQTWRLEVKETSSCEKQQAITASAPNGIRVATLAKSTVFEKWAALERGTAILPGHQCLFNKRQLSEKTKAVTMVGRVGKRVPRTYHTVNKQQTLNGPDATWNKPLVDLQINMSVTCRKLRGELFTSTDVFKVVDVHAIKAGQELRSKKIYTVLEITQRITKVAQTDLQKLRAIWTWICHYIGYDVNGYLGLSKKVTSPEQVIETGRAVCCGYSSLFQQMCRVVGIECVEVAGHGKGIGYRQGQTFQRTKSSHMWNAVFLNGQWHLLDCCWGAGRVDLDNKAFIKKNEDFYFLTDPEEFINSHCPDDSKWQLLDEPISLEEFEKRVLRTSEFYHLGLNLIYPEHFLLLSENGEATISMCFTQPLEFTYQASLSNGADMQNLTSPIGLITVTSTSMRLKLLPPVPGTFDIMVFARPSNCTLGAAFSWVCSFQLECPMPAPVDGLPENPFLSWGLLQNARGLGLTSCQFGSDPIKVNSGTFELVLPTSRPLMVLCEITHRDLDKTLAKKCLATQIEPGQLTCHVLCPFLGFYRLSVFVRDYECIADNFRNVGNLLLHCCGSTINQNELFPTNLSTFCGPGIRTLNAGLTKFSHTSPLLVTQQGKCNITFHDSQDLELHVVLSKDAHKQPELPLSRHTFLTHNSGKVTISAALPEPGVYKLSLYGKEAGSSHQDFGLLCDFILRNVSTTSWPPFPCCYTAWRKGYVLFEPRSGVLKPDSWVRFRVRVPGAKRVTVQGEQRVDLQLNKSRVWEGETFTGHSATQLKLAIAGTAEGNSNTLTIIMCFDVLNQTH